MINSDSFHENLMENFSSASSFSILIPVHRDISIKISPQRYSKYRNEIIFNAYKLCTDVNVSHCENNTTAKKEMRSL